jgi:dTDP-4-dehydrorhamnose reductase
VRILITGANGLVASRLCPLLAARGHQVIGLGRGARRVEGAFDYGTCELTDRPSVRAEILGRSPECVVHTAAMTEVDECEKRPEDARAQNVDATQWVAEAAQEVGAHLVHLSTDYVFDGEAGPYGEEDLPRPLSVYGQSKLEGEAKATSGGTWSLVRTAVVYGRPTGTRSNFGFWLYSELSAGRQVRLFSDQSVSPSSAQNVARMLAELVEQRRLGIWHLAGGEVVDRMTFGRVFCEVFGFDPGLLIPTRVVEQPHLARRPLRAGLRVEKAQQQLSEKPWDLQASLRAFRTELATSKS